MESLDKPMNAYSKTYLRDIRRRAMRIEGAESIHHIRPRAYCVAKPAPGCAVFATPWCDSEPQIRLKLFSSSITVREGVCDVQLGDWCELAYVANKHGGETRVVRKLT